MEIKTTKPKENKKNLKKKLNCQVDVVPAFNPSVLRAEGATSLWRQDIPDFQMDLPVNHSWYIENISQKKL